MKKTLFGCLISATLLLSGCGAESTQQTVTTTQAIPETKICVTLGDSISAGFGLDTPEEERYSTLLTAMLGEMDGNEWQDCNYAVSGDDSSDLLKRLNDGKAIRLPAADAIVVCIGANNLLHPFMNYLQTVMQETATDDMKKDALETLNSDAEKGLEQLAVDLDTMYEWIRERNTVDEATLYLMNVYDPFAQYHDETVPATDIPLNDFSAEKVNGLNQVLSDFAAKHDDIILVDLRTAFTSYDEILIQGQVDSENPLLIDPHPNKDGHQIIADTLFALMKEHSK